MTAPRPFILFPDPRLRGRAEEVAGVDDEVRALWEEMLAAMYGMPGRGVGLAAPQLGTCLRLAVLDCSDNWDAPVRLANPRIVWASDDVRSYPEASPNFPGLSAEITRPVAVDIAYLDEGGAEVTQRFEGLWATSIQHQIDHLDGMMFFDRLGKVKRQRLLQSHRKTSRADRRRR